MKCLLLSRYSRRGASSRLRSLQYLPYLAAAGIEVVPAPILGDRYLAHLFDGAPPPHLDVAAAYARRLGHLLRARDYDLLWIEKELFPFLPAWLEALLPHLGVSYVVDYDDAYFDKYARHRLRLVRHLLGRKIEAVMQHARIVLAGNEYIAEHAASNGARRVERLPTVVDLDRYEPATHRRHGPFTIGWIGTPWTASYLGLIRDALEGLRRRAPLRFVTVGATPAQAEVFRAEHVAWSEETEAEEIARFDVGIMPIPDEPFERGKCGYKLIQYMACGKPVVASPVGANRDIVEHGVNGFLASATSDWTETLARLRGDAALRERMGTAGRRLVEERYALQVAAPRLASLLRQAAR